MPLHIKELFLEMFNNYNHLSFIYISNVIQFNRISKIHYEWIKEIPKNHIINQIKYSLIWLNAQKLRKTINDHYLDKMIIEDWANRNLSESSIITAITMYNMLNTNKIIGTHPYYNISYKYTYPDLIPNTFYSDAYRDHYKKYPFMKEIFYHHGILYHRKGFRKLTRKDLQLLTDKPYMFKYIILPVYVEIQEPYISL